jgi:hypothetical protein
MIITYLIPPKEVYMTSGHSHMIHDEVFSDLLWRNISVKEGSERYDINKIGWAVWNACHLTALIQFIQLVSLNMF